MGGLVRPVRSTRVPVREAQVIQDVTKQVSTRSTQFQSHGPLPPVCLVVLSQSDRGPVRCLRVQVGESWQLEFGRNFEGQEELPGIMGRTQPRR